MLAYAVKLLAANSLKLFGENALTGSQGRAIIML